ncbi:hypothetical protein WDA79_16395 [Streptomyces sp. A475]|uniref:AMP-binding enzyme n=1 Tax=Streptomyces sp. A475 TaxID=3131976 RepID=UPI0030C95FA3
MPIIRGGFHADPRVTEEVLGTHTAISTAAVIGVPHESHGEVNKAFVILHPGADATPDERDARDRTQMAGYTYPPMVKIVEPRPTPQPARPSSANNQPAPHHDVTSRCATPEKGHIQTAQQANR